MTTLQVPPASLVFDPALLVHLLLFSKPISISKGLIHAPSQGHSHLAEPQITVITVITKSQANFGISHNFVPTPSAHKLLFFQCEWITKKKIKNQKIDSIHYISVIFSNRESICIIPGLITDLAPCKYCVCNPHVLPALSASGVYFCNNWCVLLHRNSG